MFLTTRGSSSNLDILELPSAVRGDGSCDANEAAVLGTLERLLGPVVVDGAIEFVARRTCGDRLADAELGTAECLTVRMLTLVDFQQRTFEYCWTGCWV